MSQCIGTRGKDELRRSKGCEDDDIRVNHRTAVCDEREATREKRSSEGYGSAEERNRKWFKKYLEEK